MLLCSNVYGIVAEIICSIAHIKAHSTDLGLQMYKTCMHTIALGIGHILVNTTKGLNFSLEIQPWLKHFHVCLKNCNSLYVRAVACYVASTYNYVDHIYYVVQR